jgi:hypothetical protein
VTYENERGKHEKMGDRIPPLTDKQILQYLFCSGRVVQRPHTERLLEEHG